jgi:hypothetical protein
MLADAIREGRSPTAKELLDAAQHDDQATFKQRSSRGIQLRLKAYGIPKAKNGAGGTSRAGS